MADIKFDENGAVITDPNYDGESRTFEELTDTEVEAYVADRKAEVAKLNDIIERKGKKVQTLNDTLKDDDVSPPQGARNNQTGADDKTKSENDRLDRIELRQEGYSPEVIDKIMELGGKNALSNPIVKKSADELQAEHDAVRATDNMGGGPNSSPETKYSREDLEKMSVEEMEQVLPHADK